MHTFADVAILKALQEDTTNVRTEVIKRAMEFMGPKANRGQICLYEKALDNLILCRYAERDGLGTIAITKKGTKKLEEELDFLESFYVGVTEFAVTAEAPTK